MGDNRPIGIFDSGVGGLTVVREVFKLMPEEQIIYFGDTARVPYGTKSERVVEKFALQDILFLLSKNVKMVVAACHTVSSMVLDRLIQGFHLPVLGVVEPGVKSALERSKNKRIGIIGTKGTIESKAYERKLKDKDRDVYVVSCPCPLFVPLAEEGWLEQSVTYQIAEIYLSPLREEKIDTLILGCTHYPLLKGVIKKVIGYDVSIIDSAEETAKIIRKRLMAFGMERKSEEACDHKFFVSDIPHQFQEIGSRFLGMKLKNISRVDIESTGITPMECGLR